MNELETKRTNEFPITMPIEKFAKYMEVGRHTANRIAEEAEAKIYIGRRVLINMERVKKYLDSVSE